MRYHWTARGYVDVKTAGLFSFQRALTSLHNRVATGTPEFEDHSTHMVGPHGKSKRYTRVVRRVYLGVSEGCGRVVDRQDTRRGLHAELFEVGRHWRRQARALHQGEPVDPIADGLDLLQGQPQVAPGIPHTELRCPFDQQGQHTELDMARHPVRRPMVDWADAQAGRLHAAE